MANLSDSFPAQQKRNLFGVNYSITDYEAASNTIITHALYRDSFGVSALAVHGLIECYNKPALREKVNRIDMVVADGQPIRWALNAFYKTNMHDRVYGPTLTWKVLEEADKKGLSVYLYGSTPSTLTKLVENIKRTFPNVVIAGTHVDRFRDATASEDIEDIRKINESGAHLVLVGRGCPRQEVWVAEHLGKINAVMMAVGAAFDFHAGTLKQAPVWMQNAGLEWFFRLLMEPNRLWKRYLFTNSKFIYLFLRKKIGFAE